MATAFSTLYPYIRVVLGDNNADFRKWGTSVLDDAIRMALLTNDDYSDDGASGVTPTIASGDDTALIIYEACRILINPQPGAHSYRTRVLSVSRDDAGKRDVMRFLEDAIYLIKEGNSLFSTDSALIAWLEHPQRLLDTYNSANVSQTGDE